MTDPTPDPASTPGPDLQKAAAAPPEVPASIWQPLDGSEPVAAVPAISFAPESGGSGTDAFGRPASTTAGAAPVGQSFVLAGWGSRFGAAIIDNILFGAVTFLIAVPIGVALGLTVSEAATFFSTSGDLPSSVANKAPFFVVIALQYLAQLCAPVFFLTRWAGQTPGKRLVGIRVVRADGLPITAGLAAKREVLGKTILVILLSIPTIGLAFILNYLWPLWDKENRAGHDAFAKTRVVQA